MKLNIKRIIGIFSIIILMYSCDTTNESGYIAEEYSAPTSFTLNEDTSAKTENSFTVTYASTAKGKGYYVVAKAGTKTPSSTEVHAGSGFLKSGKFDLDGTTTESITVDTNIYGGYDYDVYAIHKSEDNFISESVTKLTVTTPDNSTPSFIGDESEPAFKSDGNSPFTSVTFAFSEPVIYQGGAIKFAGFRSGREIIVNDAGAISASGTKITVNTHGTFAQNDFILVTWEEGTFTDKSGKSVAALTGTKHYFSTRSFTPAEAATLMEGTYNYSVQFYGGTLDNFYTSNAALFLPNSGEFELKLDETDPSGTTLLGINVFSTLNNFGFTAPEYLKIKFGADGELTVLDTPQASGIPLTDQNNNPLPVIWNHYLSGITALPGFYDVTDGTINHYISLVVAGGSGPIVDDMDYNYTRIGTYAKSTPELQKKLIERNKFLEKKTANHKTYKTSDYKVAKIK